MKNLSSIFEAKSLAVIGASNREGSVGHSIFYNLIHNGYQGVLYPVNPKSPSVIGVKAYPSIADVPDEVECAVLIVPADATAKVLEQCGQKKIKAAVIVSAGFKEVGGEGIGFEEDCKKIAKKYDISLVGPNCLGVINTDPKFSINASFARTMPRSGNIAFLSQSGALCTAVLDYAKGNNIGFSKFISIGNKADINELDLIRYLGEDEQTKVILMYLEDLVDGHAFIELARQITIDAKNKKPILAIKSGRTAAGAKAASSHTGSLAGSDNVYDAIFIQAGVMRVETVEELFALATAFSQQPLPASNRTAIVTNAGGPGIMAVDACVRAGLELVSFEKETTLKLKKALPPTANIHNPVDVIGDARADRYAAAMEAVLNDPNVDSMIVILTPQSMTAIDETAAAIAKLKNNKKPILSTFMGVTDVSSGIKILEKAGLPHFTFPESTARTLGKMAEYAKKSIRPKSPVIEFETDDKQISKIIERNLKLKNYYLPMEDVFEILKIYGFSVPQYALVKSSAEISKLKINFNYPVAIKIISADIIHKMDVGGVVLNIKDEKSLLSEVEKMFSHIKKTLPHAKLDGIFIQEMASAGREAILGMNRDPKFGALLMFGLGGSWVEVFKDVSFRLAPITKRSAQHMIESTKFSEILKGARGKKPVNMHELEEILCRLSQLVTRHPQIAELDINPLIIYEKNSVAVDARIQLVN